MFIAKGRADWIVGDTGSVININIPNSHSILLSDRLRRELTTLTINWSVSIQELDKIAAQMLKIPRSGMA